MLMRPLFCLVLTAAVSSQVEARFAELAAAGAKTFGIDKAPPVIAFEDDVVRPQTLTVQLGAVELLFPKPLLRGPTEITDLQQIGLAVCDLQRLLAEWLLGTPVPPELDAACKSVQTWLRSWRPTGAVDALGWSKAPPEALAAQARFLAAMARVLAKEPDQCRARVWLAPSRQAFGEICGLLGAIAPENKELLWTEDVLESSEAWASRPKVMQLVAMEYAAPVELGGALEGVRMDAREKGGLLQHVVQRVASSLCVLAFGDTVDRDFEAGLCQNLVVAQLKENNARTGGSGRGAYAAARSQFVAGGASSGGILPAIDLDSQWRSTKGRDCFVKPLKQGQKNGAKAMEAKEPKDKLGSFQLLEDDGKRGHVVAAPFLGRPPEKLPGVPANVAGDFKELLRAYRSGFIHWLREAGGKSQSDSRQKFAAMLRELAQGGGKVAFELAARRAFGDRLSGDGPTPSSLEWRFLAWLAR